MSAGSFKIFPGKHCSSRNFPNKIKMLLNVVEKCYGKKATRVHTCTLSKS